MLPYFTTSEPLMKDMRRQEAKEHLISPRSRQTVENIRGPRCVMTLGVIVNACFAHMCTWFVQMNKAFCNLMIRVIIYASIIDLALKAFCLRHIPNDGRI